MATTYIMNVYRHNTSNMVCLGDTRRKGKAQMLKEICNNGPKVVELFDDCGDFNFEWCKADKVWYFYDETGQKVGHANYITRSSLGI